VRLQSRLDGGGSIPAIGSGGAPRVPLPSPCARGGSSLRSSPRTDATSGSLPGKPLPHAWACLRHEGQRSVGCQDSASQAPPLQTFRSLISTRTEVYRRQSPLGYHRPPRLPGPSAISFGQKAIIEMLERVPTLEPEVRVMVDPLLMVVVSLCLIREKMRSVQSLGDGLTSF
jgi:hypothetical protein